MFLSHVYFIYFLFENRPSVIMRVFGKNVLLFNNNQFVFLSFKKSLIFLLFNLKDNTLIREIICFVFFCFSLLCDFKLISEFRLQG